ncbi:MAG: type II toxin-antitoxin system HicB family antitoxin [Lachnospiraceae bacterium]|nr:type II toxin-antitoxin system HicB family antitoxin [Lachnospiraceae bacterium]
MSIKTFTLRLNEEQHRFLDEKSAELGTTKNDYIRQLIVGEIRNDKQDKILSEIMEIKAMLERSDSIGK